MMCLPLMVLLSMFPGSTGKPMLNIVGDTKELMASWKKQEQKLASYVQEKSGQRLPDALVEEDDRTPLEVYRWQDENGVWHFSQEKPVAGTQAKTIKVTRRINSLMPAPRDDLPEYSSSNVTTQNTQNKTNQHEEVTPFNVLEKAKALQVEANKRNQMLDAL